MERTDANFITCVTDLPRVDDRGCDVKAGLDSVQIDARIATSVRTSVHIQ